MDKSQPELTQKTQKGALRAGVFIERGDFILRAAKNWDEAYSVIEECIKNTNTGCYCGLSASIGEAKSTEAS